MKKNPTWPLMVAVLCLATGCLHSVSAEKGDGSIYISPKVLYAGGQCGPCGAGAEWITDLGKLESAYRMARRDLVSGSQNSLPEIDFERFGVLRICMGTRPSGGYKLALAAAEAEVRKETATIFVHWSEPSPGAMVAQVVTSPCLLVQVPRDSFCSVEVKDQSGVIRCRIDVH